MIISYCHLVHLFTPKTCTYFCSNGEVKAHSGEPQLAACERSQKPEKPGSRWQRSICTQLISPTLFWSWLIFAYLLLDKLGIGMCYVKKHQLWGIRISYDYTKQRTTKCDKNWTKYELTIFIVLCSTSPIMQIAFMYNRSIALEKSNKLSNRKTSSNLLVRLQ